MIKRIIFVLVYVYAVVLSVGCSGSNEISVTGSRPYRDTESDTDRSLALFNVSQSDEEVLGMREAVLTEDVTSEQLKDDGSATSLIVVYVCGAVKEPDVYYLSAGCRVYDALQAAGGFSEDADTQWLNLAEELSDGEMIYVYTFLETSAMEEEGVKRGSVSAGGTTGTGGVSTHNSSSISNSNGSGGESVVNLNTATREELMSLPGIGETKADSIIRYREENGPFISSEDIMNVSGIKNSIYSMIQDRITV